MNFTPGDIIRINQTYVRDTLGPDKTPKRKALFQLLSKLGNRELLVSRIYDDPIIKVSKIGYSSRPTKVLSFNSQNEILNAFEVITEFSPQNLVKTAYNDSSDEIFPGMFVTQTNEIEGTPWVRSTVKSEVATSPIFGIANKYIAPHASGEILIEGYYDGVRMNPTSISECFLELESQTSAHTIPGKAHQGIVIGLDLGRTSLVYLPKQPGGPKDHFEPRSITGFANSKENLSLGQSYTSFQQLASVPRTLDSLPDPETISDQLITLGDDPNQHGLSNFIWMWGLFIFRDICHIGTKDELLVNERSCFLDASGIYGNTVSRAAAMRSNSNGKLTTVNGLLAPNTTLEVNHPSYSDPQYFLTGDPRANELLPLLALQTVMANEHNRVADQIKATDSSLNDEQLYQAARRYVTALVQSITYNEFLPALLGGQLLGYDGYNPYSNPSAFRSFATLQNFIYSTIPSFFNRLDISGDSIPQGPADLCNSIHRPDRLIEGGSIEPLLLGASKQLCNKVSTIFADTFIENNPCGLKNLIACTITQERNYGSLTYPALRASLRLRGNPLELDVYTNHTDIDGFIGILCENKTDFIGDTLTTLMARQFELLRAGDRFYYRRLYAGSLLQEIEATTLSQVVQRNTNLSNIQDDIFIV